MLKSILIKDFTLIDELEISFHKGLNILTGETGAGKSIIIDAIDAALGARSNKDLIKEGKEKASIELYLESKNPLVKEFFDENGIDFDDEILLYREITHSNTRSRVNGVMVAQSTLQELKNLLIDIHSQHQTYKYIQPKTHITLLDEYGNGEHKALLENYSSVYKKLSETKKTFEQKLQQNTDVEKKIDFLKFQINEIEQAEITDTNEFGNLKTQREKIINAKDLKELSYSSYYTIYGQDSSILSTLSTIESKLIKASQYDPELSKIADNLSESATILRDVSESLRDYSEALSCDPYLLEKIEERLNLLDKLRRKYGATLDGILKSLETFQQELDSIEHAQEDIENLEAQITTLEAESNTLANRLSASRKILAKELSTLIENELHQLAMPNAKFETEIKTKTKDSNGIDEVEFLISANPGESPKPLAKIASGGEISRVMLAIKAIFAKTDSINTVIFDEIDTGISGPTLQSVADKMKVLSKSHQIICITHQPIIAAAADKHLHVEKHQDLISTKVEIKELNFNDKIQILSRIAGGEINEKTTAFAKELLEKYR